MENQEKTVHVKLQKQLLESERIEKKEKRTRRILIFLLMLLVFAVGAIIGYSIKGDLPNTSSGKLEEIKYYLKTGWLFANDYDDLDNLLNDKAYYGMTDFEDDPYTSYMSADELDEFSNSINMNYVGIGVQYSNADGIATITRVFKDSPAEIAGLLAGDIIVEVIDKNIDGLESEEIRELVLGEEKTPVVITVVRGSEELDIEVIRGAVDSTVYAYSKDDYVVLEIMSFGEGTAEECVRYLEDYRDYKKIIIDLRDDSGGYQTAVQEVAGLFLGPDQVVMDQIYNNGTRTTFKTISLEYYDNFEKIVILTNEYTASAAEVLAICLKELHPNTTLVGTTTFGKGVVQSTYMLSDGESGLKLTASKWLSPNGIWVNGEGIKPDIEVQLDDVLYLRRYEMEENESYDIDSVSEFTKFAQKALKYLDYEVSRDDGYFDESLKNTIIQFQNDNNIDASGLVDETTYNTLITKVLSTYSQNPEKDAQMNKAIEVLNN